MYVAIDFGTTNTTVSYINTENEIETGIQLFRDTEIHFKYPFQKNKLLIPSVIGTSEGKIIIGEKAKTAGDAFYNMKRKLYENPEDQETLERTKKFLITLLDSITNNIDFNKETDHIVFTRPVETKDYERSRRYETVLKQIFIDYGVPENQLTSVSEPLAASVFYRTRKDRQTTELLIDFGGGTIDIVLYSIELNNIISLLRKYGDASVGGSQIDLILANEFCKMFEGCQPNDPSMLIAMEEGKIRCAMEPNPDQRQTFIFEQNEQSWSFKELEEILNKAEYTSKLRKVFRDLQKQINIPLKEIDQVILVGGSSNLPLISDILHNDREIDIGKLIIDQEEMFTCIVKGALIHRVKPEYVSNRLKYSYLMKVCLDFEKKTLGEQLLFEKGSVFPQSIKLHLKAAETKSAFGIKQSCYRFDLLRQASESSRIEELGCRMRDEFSEENKQKELIADFNINNGGELLMTIQEQHDGKPLIRKILDRII